MINRKHILIALCTLLLAGVLAQAQSSHGKKKKITVGEMLKKAKEDSRGGKAHLLQKGDTSLPQAQMSFESRQPVNLSSVKPPRSSEILKYENSDQSQYEKTLDLQIKELYKLTQQFRNSSSRGELWLRLAELYVEKSALVDARKQDDYDKKLAAFQSGKIKLKPRLDVAEARDYNKKAIQLYEWFLRDYPKDNKVSQALFFLGYNQFELGNASKGSAYYSRLTKEFPNSPFIGEAHFALGEYYFESEKWADAYKEYSQLIKDQRHRLNTFALYKGAWCLYRLGKTEQGIKYLDFIIKGAANDGRGSLAGGRKLNTSRLEAEALRDMVIFFADLGDTKRAIEYFRNINSREARNNIEKLAYIMADKGNREGSKEVFRMLIAQDANGKKAFEYQYQIVQAYFFSKNSPQFKEELYRWIADYDQKSSWYAANKEDEAFIQNSIKLREQTLRNYILQQHQTAQNSRAPFSRQAATDGYTLYFKEFSDSPQASDMHFFHAELLYDIGKYDEASIEYSWVAENAPNSKFGAKASQNVLLSIEKALPKDTELQKRVGDSIEPIPMDPKVERFIKYASLYLQKFPNSDKDAEIRFRIGRLYYQTNNFAPAEKNFKEIVQKHPNTKYSEYSANLLLDIFSLKKDYAGLEKMGTELLANDQIKGTKAGNDIRTVLERTQFKKAQDLEIEKKYADSATQFQVFATQYPKSELATMAFFNAGVNFERAGRNAEAVQSYKKVMAANDKSAESLKPKTQKLLAKLYQDAGQFEESAALFKQLAKDNPKDPLTPNYLYNSAVMYQALGKTTESVNAYLEYIDVNRSQTENADTLFTIAQMQRKAGAKQAALNHYKEYVQLPYGATEKKLEANYWIYDIGRTMGRHKEPEEAQENVLSLQRKVSGDKKSFTSSFVAKIKFNKAKETFANLKSVTIPADPAKQKKAVDRKLETMNQLNQELTDVIKLDSAEEIVSALDLLGESNRHMADAIDNTPLPPNLKEEQKKMYKAEIEKISLPFRKKSEDSYKAAVERGSDLDVYGPAYQNAYAQLNRINPKSYYSNGETGMDSRLINWIGAK